MATRKKNPSLEQALNDLENLVAQLEQGQLPLEESLKVFEEGIQLCQEARNTLLKAEQRVQILMGKNGDHLQEDFVAHDDPTL